ncbi:flap structure-specific endonuclease, partial [Candidatus Woesearchaeota archaeon]|nr:flap structure-specific endonuclease [Candidatus Woesearchaeota archaeon]
MGVNLREILPRKEITFEFLAGKKIAIDFSNSAYQFLSSIRQPDGTPLMDAKGRIT